MPSKDNIFYIESDNDQDDQYIYSDYTMQYKTSKGDTVRIELLDHDETKVYNVALSIGKRKKGYKYLEQTGRSGLEGLVAAKIMMEELLKCLYPGEKLTVYGDDMRRYNIYKHYLLPLGFVEKGLGKDKHLEYECQK